MFSVAIIQCSCEIMDVSGSEFWMVKMCVSVDMMGGPFVCEGNA